MTTIKAFDTNALATLSRAMIGLDRHLQHLTDVKTNASLSNYPPHNIYKETDDTYVIEMAVAGFTKDEISIELNQNELTIKGYKPQSPENVVEYLYRGLAMRNFEKVLYLTEYLVVDKATVSDGMLKIILKLIIPDALKPRRIEIE